MCTSNRKPYKIYLWVYLLLTIHSGVVVAQVQHLGSWSVVNLKYTHSDHWSGFTEAQLRSLRLYDHFHYYEYKAGIDYRLSKDIRATIGLGRYETYREGGNFILPKNNSEWRLWPQMVFLNHTSICTIEHRYRAEMRFSDADYRTRLRYRLGVQIPLAFFEKLKKKCQVGLSTEIFFGTIEPYFQRNRLQAAVQYKVNSVVSFQTGYIYQFDYRILDETGTDFFMTGVFFHLHRKLIQSLLEEIGVDDN